SSSTVQVLAHPLTFFFYSHRHHHDLPSFPTRRSSDLPVSTSQDATYSRLQDINGDGLPDRLMRSYSAPYTNFVVQLNKGPFPDLLATISNNIGGRVTVTYAPSTSFDNRDQNGISQLPFPVYVVTSVVKDDGLG